MSESGSTPVPNGQRISFIDVELFPPSKQEVPTANSTTPNKKSKRIRIKGNLTIADYATYCCSECIGTAILVLLGCMGCVSGLSGIPTHLQICLTFGIAVMIAIQCFGHVSGAHINPVVTVTALILGHVPLLNGLVYFFGQLIGAIGGFALLQLVTPTKFLESEPGVCSPAINPQITTMQGFMVEFLASLILVLVCCAIWDCRNSTKHDSVPIRFGLTIAALAIAAGPYTGANMNPVRSFAPALFNGDWDNHWVYWIAPLLSAVVGGTLYRFVFSHENIGRENGEPQEVVPLK